MYGLVPYNISPIQQGIQYGHAVDEYGIKKSRVTGYREWLLKHKTYIILNGGTTNLKTHSLGTLNQHRQTLLQNGVHIACFYEPDLGDQLTAVVFLVDERVFNKKKYPDPTDEDPNPKWMKGIVKSELNKILFLKEFLSQFRLA